MALPPIDLDAVQRDPRAAIHDHFLRSLNAVGEGSDWITEWLAEPTVNEAVQDPVTCADLSGRIGWSVRVNSSDGTSHGRVPRGIAWRDIAANADDHATRMFCELMELVEYRYDFKFEQLRAALSRASACSAAPEIQPFLTSLQAFALVGIGDRTSMAAGLQLVDSALHAARQRPVEQRGQTYHACLQALWLHSGTASAGVKVAEDIIQLASEMVGLGIDGPNVYFRTARARMSLGDLAGAIADIDRALELSPTPELTSQYIVERAMLTMALHLERGMAERSKETLKLQQQQLAEQHQQAVTELHNRIDSALVFNLQMIFALFVIVSIGGAAVGVGSALVERAPSSDVGDVLMVGGAVAGIVLAFSLLLVGLSTRMLRRALERARPTAPGSH